MLGLMKFKKLFWKKSDEHDKLDELDHEFIAGFTKREIIRMIQSTRQTGKTSVPLARVRFAEIEYDDFVKNNTFKLVHQVDATELEYNKRYRFFVDSSFIAEYSIKKITLLDENKKAIPMQRNYDMVCEAYSDCGNILLTIK